MQHIHSILCFGSLTRISDASRWVVFLRHGLAGFTVLAYKRQAVITRSTLERGIARVKSIPSNRGLVAPNSANGSYPLQDYDKSDNSQLKSIGSAKMRSGGRGKRKSKGFLHPLSIPNDTASGSDEAIVGKEAEGKREVGLEAGEVRDGMEGGGMGPGGVAMTREWEVSEALRVGDLRMGEVE